MSKITESTSSNVGGAGEPTESIIRTLQQGEWCVTDRYDMLILVHDTLDLSIIFIKEPKGKLCPSKGTEWMTPAERAGLTNFVTAWLPAYHRSCFMKLAKEN